MFSALSLDSALKLSDSVALAALFLCQHFVSKGKTKSSDNMI